MNIYLFSGLLKNHNLTTRFYPKHVPYSLIRSFRSRGSYYYRSLMLMKFQLLNESKYLLEDQPRLVIHSSLMYIDKRTEFFAKVKSSSLGASNQNPVLKFLFKYCMIPLYKKGLITREKIQPYYLMKKFVYNSKYRRGVKIIFLVSLVLFALIQISCSYIKQIQKESFRIRLAEILSNEALINEIAKSLIVLVKQKNIQDLTADGLSKLLNNESFRADTKLLVTNLIVDYLASVDCYLSLSKIIISDIYGSEKVIEEIFKLVKDLVSVRQIFDLENLLEDSLKKILSNQGLIENIKQSLQNETISSFSNEGMIRLTVNNLLGYFKD